MEKNDEVLITELVRRHLKSVYNFVWRMVGDEEAAEDITQETFIKVWKNLEKFQPNANFKTWLLAIARNTSIDWLRRRKELVFSAWADENGEENFFENNLVDDAPLAGEIFDRIKDAQTLEKLLSKILPLDRTILSLHYGEELTFDEIGEILGRPLNTVKGRHRRALVVLRKLLKKS